MKTRFQLEFQWFGAVLLSIFATVAVVFAPMAEAAQSVDETQLVRELEVRMDRVPQFKFMREEAEKLGVKVYLFGGTASGFAHYVRWDMLRERGEEGFLKEFFDYDFFSIYRSTQDLDVVVDGPKEKAEELGRRLRDKYPTFQGSKDQWEVRLLRETSGDKLALLGDADFNKQHSDSNSTGLIEVTRSGEPKVRDLRGWDQPRSRFLEDIAQGKITYYFSSEHETTARYLKGKNPPIYSVIRFLTKAFQYDLELRPEDVATARRMIDAFDPANPGKGIILDKADFEFWMHGTADKLSNAKKLFQHSVDVERTWNVLEDLGLRKKLASLKFTSDSPDRLEVLMNREPLRTGPVGTGTGRTAEQLKIDIVAHETKTASALESLTRSKKGWVNAFISRQGASGESAHFGDGFYAKVGNEGAVGSGLTIRFRLDPKARLGTDFLYEKGVDYVVVKNKRALQVIPESLDCSLEDWFKVMQIVGSKNLGLMMRLDLRLQTKWQAATPAEQARITTSIKQDLRTAIEQMRVGYKLADTLSAWFHLPLSARFAAEALLFVKTNPSGYQASAFLGLKHWRTNPRLPEMIEALLKTDAARYLYNQEWFTRLLGEPDVMRLPQWKKWMKPSSLDYQGAHKVGDILTWPAVMANPLWTELVDHHIKLNTGAVTSIATSSSFESSPHWERWMNQLFESDLYMKQAGAALLTERALRDPRWWRWVYRYTEKAYQAQEGLTLFINTVIRHKSIPQDEAWLKYARHILRLPDNHVMDEFERSLHHSRRTGSDVNGAKVHLMWTVRESPELRDGTDLIELGLRSGATEVIDSIRLNVLEKGELANRPDLLVLWLKVAPRRFGGAPIGGSKVLSYYARHPAFKGVVPFSPGWLTALVDKGWDLRDGRFQAPERTKPMLPFMRKPVNCPSLFVK